MSSDESWSYDYEEEYGIISHDDSYEDGFQYGESTLDLDVLENLQHENGYYQYFIDDVKICEISDLRLFGKMSCFGSDRLNIYDVYEVVSKASIYEVPEIIIKNEEVQSFVDTLLPLPIAEECECSISPEEYFLGKHEPVPKLPNTRIKFYPRVVILRGKHNWILTENFAINETEFFHKGQCICLGSSKVCYSVKSLLSYFAGKKIALE